MPIEYNPETGQMEATGNCKTVCLMAGITPEQLEMNRAGAYDPPPPTPDLLKALGIDENEYWGRVSGIMEQHAAHWAICEGVLLKHYTKSRQPSLKEQKQAQKESEEAAKMEIRRQRAIEAEKNRQRFFNGQ